MKNKKEKINKEDVNKEDVNVNEKLKNIKELEKTKKKYLRLRNTVLIILSIIIVIVTILSASFAYKYIKISKILKDNVAADLGDNCKISFYYDGEKVPNHTIYINNGLVKNVTPIISDVGGGELTFIGIIDGYNYIINDVIWSGEVTKTYSKMKVSEIELENYDVTKINLLESFYSGNPKVPFLDVAKFIIKDKGRIEKEEYNGKEYIVLRRGEYAKCYINPETNLAEKIVGGSDRNRTDINIVIEKNAVKEEIKLPDLTEYVYKE